MFITLSLFIELWEICTDSFIYMATRCDGLSTPVSVLIHAANHGYAGIYLLYCSNSYIIFHRVILDFYSCNRSC